jgi:hypothetical protein
MWTVWGMIWRGGGQVGKERGAGELVLMTMQWSEDAVVMRSRRM